MSHQNSSDGLSHPIQLYGYWRSSATYRVRIALALKGVDYELVPVHMLKSGGEQHSDSFHQLNPNELVPVLKQGSVEINQSLVIMDYLDDHFSSPRLVPEKGQKKYLIQSLAQDVAIDVHPINNLRVGEYLVSSYGVTGEQKVQWMQHWIERGFTALEERISKCRGRFCVGDTVSLVDVCLVPQVYNAKRFGVDMTQFPNLNEIDLYCNTLDAFVDAHPSNQPDAEL